MSLVGVVADNCLSALINCWIYDSGVEGGVRTLTRGICLIKSCVGGDLYVIPIAPWRPARSCFWGMKLQ